MLPEQSKEVYRDISPKNHPYRKALTALGVAAIAYIAAENPVNAGGILESSERIPPSDVNQGALEIVQIAGTFGAIGTAIVLFDRSVKRKQR